MTRSFAYSNVNGDSALLDSNNYMCECNFAVDTYIFADGSKKHLTVPYPIEYGTKWFLKFFKNTNLVGINEKSQVTGYNTKLNRCVQFKEYSWWTTSHSTPSRTVSTKNVFGWTLNTHTIPGTSSSETLYTAHFSFDDPIEIANADGYRYKIAEDSSGKYYYEILPGGQLISGGKTTVVPVSFVGTLP